MQIVGSSLPAYLQQQALLQFPFRFTMEHIPYWSGQRMSDGYYYAPQYATDKEWLEHTLFEVYKKHGELVLKVSADCYSQNQSWPLGKKLEKPYQREQTCRIVLQ